MKFEDIVIIIRSAKCAQPESMNSESTILAIRTGILSMVLALKDTVPIGLLYDAAMTSLKENGLTLLMENEK